MTPIIALRERHALAKIYARVSRPRVDLCHVIKRDDNKAIIKADVKKLLKNTASRRIRWYLKVTVTSNNITNSNAIIPSCVNITALCIMCRYRLLSETKFLTFL